MSVPVSSGNPNSSSTDVYPSGHQKSTGSFVIDVTTSVKNVTQIPCARNSLLSGIASGVGIAFIRGLSAGPLMAGHWAMATFTIISLGSWHLCQRRLRNEQQMMQRVVDSLPQRTLKNKDTSEVDTSS